MDLVKIKHLMIDNRNLTIDLLKGFLIYLVVLGHTISGNYMNGLSLNFEESLRYIVYLFHMPLFFFLSGYLIKIEKLNKVYLFKKIKYIGIVFLISSLIYLIVFSSISIKSIALLITSPYNHLWFLEVLMLYFIVICLLKNVNYKKVLLLSIVLAILGTGFRDFGTTIFNQLGYKPIFRGIEYFVYFYIGYALQNNLINSKLYQFNKNIIFLFFILFISFTIINLKINLLSIDFYLSYSLGFVGLNILLIFIINQYLNLKFKNELMIQGGGASLFIYLWHYGIITVSLHIIDKYCFSNLLIDVLLSIFIFVGLIFLNKFLSRFIYFKYLGVR